MYINNSVMCSKFVKYKKHLVSRFWLEVWTHGIRTSSLQGGWSLIMLGKCHMNISINFVMYFLYFNHHIDKFEILIHFETTVLFFNHKMKTSLKTLLYINGLLSCFPSLFINFILQFNLRYTRN